MTHRLIPALAAVVLLSACADDAALTAVDAALTGPPSAARLAGESFEEARARALGALGPQPFSAEVLPTGSAASGAEDYVTLDTARVTPWDAANLAAGFELARDLRAFEWDKDPSFDRRPTFLYPDDGCFARAQLMGDTVPAAGLERPTSVFVFGDLEVATENSPYGRVGWWYHVAPIVEVDGDAWVLDPSIDPSGPLLFEDWVALQGDAEATARVCAPGVVTPVSTCFPVEAEVQVDQATIQWLFGIEWKRQLDLGRDPTVVLGDTPPWLAEPVAPGPGTGPEVGPQPF